MRRPLPLVAAALLLVAATLPLGACHPQPAPSTAGVATDGEPQPGQQITLFDGHLLFTLPTEWEAIPTPAVAPDIGGPQHWFADPTHTFRVQVSHTTPNTSATIENVCKDLTLEAMGLAGAELLHKRVTKPWGRTQCDVEVRTGPARTRQAFFVLEGRETKLAFFYPSGESAWPQVASDILASVQIRPTQHGTACDAKEAARCVSDQAMGVCREGRWDVQDCEASCKDSNMPAGPFQCTTDEHEATLCLCGVSGLAQLLDDLDWQAGQQDAAAAAADAVAARASEWRAKARHALVESLSKSVRRVSGTTPADYRVLIASLRALGAIGGPSAGPPLVETAFESAGRNFVIVPLATELLGRLRQASLAEHAVRSMYLFDSDDPRYSNTREGAMAVLRTGPATVPFLLRVLRGEDAWVQDRVRAYVKAARAVAPEVAASLSVEEEVADEAAFAIAQLGLPDAIEPLRRLTDSDRPRLQMVGAIGLVSLAHDPATLKDTMQRLERKFRSSKGMERVQVLRAIQHLFYGGAQPLLRKVMAGSTDDDAETRGVALEAYALLADAKEAREAQALIERHSALKQRANLPTILQWLRLAETCDADAVCWRKALDTDDGPALRKASWMVGRYSRGDAEAVRALIPRISFPDTEVRYSVLDVLDVVASRGSEEAVRAIDALEAAEKGQQRWNEVQDRAHTVRERLRWRALAAQP